MTDIYSMCSSGCEKHHSEMAGVLVVLVMPGHKHNHVFGDQVIGQVRTVFGGTYCQGDLKKGLGSMMFTISDKER